MNSPSKVALPQQVRRIGILLGDLGKLNKNKDVLMFLVLQMNMLQKTFEYEFLPVNCEDEFIQKLSNQSSIDMHEAKKGIITFIKRYQEYLNEEIESYAIKEKASTSYLVLVTTACFENYHYSTVGNGLAILALGDWKRYMAPPSLIEFILTLIIRESIALVCPPLDNSVHLGTRGCLCDFTTTLDEVKLKVLNGFLCHFCCAVLASEGFTELPKELSLILKKDWLGKVSEPEKPAGVAAKLGYDLFTTKGPQTTWWEITKKTLQEEWMKTVLTILGGIVLAALLLWSRLKN